MKVSAIVSAYFCAEFLEGRILNLNDQTLRPEIVCVVQEGSEEQRIAEKHLDDFWDIIVPTQDTPTIYRAWNLGIEVSRGEYLTNANSDDRLAKRAIKQLSDELDRRPEIGVVYADCDIVSDLSGGFDYAWREGYFRFLEGGFQELLTTCFLGPFPMWRRELHDKYGLFDESLKSSGDLEMWLRLTGMGVKLHHIRESLGIYLRRPDQAEQRFRADGTANREDEEVRARYR